MQHYEASNTPIASASGSLSSTPAAAALFVSAFFDELIRCGVCDVVISPGSRSTPLAMVAYASSLKLHINIDERSAAFYALGLAKASGRPPVLICTSGTAVANYYPAIMEAESSRVPLIILTGDRPPQLQNLGAPQTCDQLNAFGHHVRHFQQMPLPSAHPQAIAFARQMALVAFSQAVGAHASKTDAGALWYGCISNAGPAHFNFPFEEPLKPDLNQKQLFTCGRKGALSIPSTEVNASTSTYSLDSFSDTFTPGDASLKGASLNDTAEVLPPLITAQAQLDPQVIEKLQALIQQQRTLVLCGEGSVSSSKEAQCLIAWSKAHELPLIADPLSNLRSFDDPLIIDNYDNLFDDETCEQTQLVIRFGRYPVSKSCFTALAKHRPIQIVVDAVETRDFNASTDIFIRSTPADFIASLTAASLQSLSPDSTVSPGGGMAKQVPSTGQQAYAARWISRNAIEARRNGAVSETTQGFEGAYIHRLFNLAPAGSCIYSASSMAIRLIDTFYLKQNRKLNLLCNRGLNGIDGCLSSAIGAAHYHQQTTLVIGDLALLHDINALALQQELLRPPSLKEPIMCSEGLVKPDAVLEGSTLSSLPESPRSDASLTQTSRGEYPVLQSSEEGVPSLIIVLINNQGGGIFEMLPQQSNESYFKRLFLTPQDVDFSSLAGGFKIPYSAPSSVEEFESAYTAALGMPGISLIEISAQITGLKERYGNFLT